VIDVVSQIVVESLTIVVESLTILKVLTPVYRGV